MSSGFSTFAPPPATMGVSVAAAVSPGRAQSSPDGQHFMLRSDTGWVVVGTGSGVHSPPFAPHDVPATWLGPERVVWGDGNSVCAGRVTADGVLDGGELSTFSRRVTALLGPVGPDFDHIAVTVGGGEVLGSDFFFMDGQGATRHVRHVELDLVHDSAAWGQGLACVGAGLQSSEVRFLWGEDGRWQSRTSHAGPVRTIAGGRRGLVASIDHRGMVLIWRGEQPRPFADFDLTAYSGLFRPRPVEALFVDLQTLVVLYRPRDDIEVPQATGSDPSALVFGPGGLRHTLAGVTGLPTSVSGAAQVPMLCVEGWRWTPIADLHL